MPFIFDTPSLTTTTITKYDGSTFTTSGTLPSGAWHFSGPTSQGVYIANSFAGCYKSNDLITWTSCTTIPSGFSYDMVQGETNGNIVMICSGSQITTTTDGVTWGSVVNLPSIFSYASVTYIDSISTWVISQTYSGTGVGKTCYSTDNGATWTASGTIPSASSPYIISNGASLIAHDVQPWGNSTTSPVYVSTGTTPGATWTLRNPAAGNPNILLVKKTPGSNGRMLAVYGSSSTAYYSDNAGASWTSVTLPSASAWQYGAYCIGIGFIVSVYNSTTSIFSSDGITWSALTNSVNPKMPMYGTKYNFSAAQTLTTATVSSIGSIVKSTKSNLVTAVQSSIGIANKFWPFRINMAISSSHGFSAIGYLYFQTASAIQNSLGFTYKQSRNILQNAISNSISFQVLTSKLFGVGRSFVYAFSKWVGVSNASSNALYSSDGFSWNVSSTPYGSWSGIATNGTVTVAIASNTNTNVYTSNGSSWSISSMPANRAWTAIASDGTKFVAIAASTNKCAYGTDGITWSEATLPQIAPWCSIAWNGTVFCAISGTNVAATSTDGITWAQQTMPDNINYTSIAWALGKFTAVAAGPTNLAAQSTDGASWSRIYMPSSADWTQVGPGIGNPNV